MTYRAADYVRYRVIEGEAVLINQRAGEVLALDEIGTRVFQLLQERGSLQEVFEALASEFAADPATLERDVRKFVQELCAAGLVEEVDDPR